MAVTLSPAWFRTAAVVVVASALVLGRMTLVQAQREQARPVPQSHPTPPTPPTPPPPVEKLGDRQFRIGRIAINSATREVRVPGQANRVTLLEFVANTRGGMKAYESAVTLDTDAISFNTALLLIGLDKAHAVVPTRHFDPMTPAGDPVELWVEWDRGSEHVRIGVEQLLYDRRAKQTFPAGKWVYTGSTFLQNGRYLADLDGVLIGFVHSPAPIIESAEGMGVGRYGQIVLNPDLGLAPNTPVTLTVKALPAP